MFDRLRKHKHADYLIKFFFAGGVATLFNLSIFYGLYKFFGVYYLYSSGIGYFLGVMLGFLLHRNFTFHANGKLASSPFGGLNG